MFTFRLGRIGVASTAIYSIDRSLFRFAAPGATDAGSRVPQQPSRSTRRRAEPGLATAEVGQAA